jgi:DNA-binding response OmpR family regulator
MRYLIAETDWTLMSLAAEIAGTGTLLTRSDRIEDLPQFLRLGEADVVILGADQIGAEGLSLAALRRAAGTRPLALVAPAPGPAQVADWLGGGADLVIDSARPAAEALARLAAVARRSHGLPQPVIDYGALRLDLRRRQAYLRDCPMKLSPKLYEVLEYLALRPGRLVTRGALLSHLYGLQDEPDPRIFDVYICNLRACLAAIAEAVDIETARGAGFRLAVRGRDAAIAA